MQTIRRRASQFQIAIDIIRKLCIISSDIKESHNIMNNEETSLKNDRNMLLSQLRQLVEYYTHSSTFKGLEGNICSEPKKIL